MFKLKKYFFSLLTIGSLFSLPALITSCNNSEDNSETTVSNYYFLIFLSFDSSESAWKVEGAIGYETTYPFVEQNATVKIKGFINNNSLTFSGNIESAYYNYDGSGYNLIYFLTTYKGNYQFPSDDNIYYASVATGDFSSFITSTSSASVKVSTSSLNISSFSFTLYS